MTLLQLLLSVALLAIVTVLGYLLAICKTCGTHKCCDQPCELKGKERYE